MNFKDQIRFVLNNNHIPESIQHQLDAQPKSFPKQGITNYTKEELDKLARYQLRPIYRGFYTPWKRGGNFKRGLLYRMIRNS